MGIQAKLYIEGEEFTVLESEFSFEQNTYKTGRPTSFTEFKGIRLVIESKKGNPFFEWATTLKETKQAELHFLPRILGSSKTRKLYLIDALCVSYKLNFSNSGNQPMTETIVLSCGGVKNSDAETEYSAYWRTTFPQQDVEPTILEQPTPNIIGINWLNPETRENLKETTYTANVALTAQVENQENNSATITITKEDGTEFENGKTELSFEEAINEDGTIELTGLEIKEQWEEFKTADIDKLIAKINHNGYQKKSSVLKVIPPPKVQVSFRPHKGYKGEFGFDWIRTGDTKRDGDKDWYANIIGKYYKDAAYRIPNDDINGWKVNGLVHWKKDLEMYDSLLKSFKRKIDIDWKKKAGKKDFLYPVPIITLLPNDNEAILDVHIEIKETPKKLELKPQTKNTGIQLSSANITIKAGVLEGFLKVKCNKPLIDHLIVDVLADDQICGQFMVLQNDASVVRDINVVLVHVNSDINGKDKNKAGSPISGGEDLLNRTLKQALVKANIKTMPDMLDIRGTYVPLLGYEISNDFRDKFATKHGRTYRIDKNANNLLQYLNDEFDDQFSDYLKNNTIDYRVYFIGEAGAWNGFAMKTQNSGVYFPGHNDATIPHELMHAMGLAHTFVNSDADAAAKYTYKAGQTTNIMDYSHQTAFGKKDRDNLFYWQMKILNPKLK